MVTANMLIRNKNNIKMDIAFSMWLSIQFHKAILYINVVMIHVLVSDHYSINRDLCVCVCVCVCIFILFIIFYLKKLNIIDNLG